MTTPNAPKVKQKWAQSLPLRNLKQAREILGPEFWGGRRKNLNFGVRETWVEMLTQSLMNFVTLHNSINLSEPQYSNLKNEDNIHLLPRMVWED